MEKENELLRVQRLLTEAGVKPKRAFGQNFLIDEQKISAIVNYFPVETYATVVEIGPGLGALTLPLMRKTKNLIAVENDRDMVKILTGLVAYQPQVTIVNQPFEKWQPTDLTSPILLIGNLPYNLTTKLIECSIKLQAQDLGLMVQKEVADKLIYQKDAKDNNALACYLALLGPVRKVIEVPKGSFYPIPQVDSTFVSLKINQQVPFSIYTGLQKLFQTPNKKLSNILPKLITNPPKVTKILKDFAPLLSLRARQVEPPQLQKLVEALENEK